MTDNEKLAQELSECVDIMPKTLKEVQSAVYNACLDAITIERSKVVAEVESWLVDEEVYSAPQGELIRIKARNELRAEWRAKLQEMKGGNDHRQTNVRSA